jgi:hypothetical protein
MLNWTTLHSTLRGSVKTKPRAWPLDVFYAYRRDFRRLIKDFEREARTDGMPAHLLAGRKRDHVQTLNKFIDMKKQYVGGALNKPGRAGEAATPKPPMSRSEQRDGEMKPRAALCRAYLLLNSESCTAVAKTRRPV